MPTYEYACRSCGHHLEAVQSFDDEPLTECPACQEAALRKVFSPIGIAFKGTGFYKTDTRPGGKRAPAGAAKSSEKSDKPEKSTKSEQSAASGSKSETSTSNTSGKGEAKSA